MRYLNISLAGIIFVATPAAAGPVLYDIYLEGPARSTLVFKVDTRGLPNNGVVQPADFTAVLKRNNGSQVSQRYRIAALRSGKVYEWRKTHGIAGASAVSPSGISWGVRAVGTKADGASLESVRPTDFIRGDVTVGPPPSGSMIAHCKAYSEIAIRQFYDARNRQCGFVGSRWSSNYQYHYLWCVGVTVPVSNQETQARATAFSSCARG
jgi:hypothetical protein